MNTKLTVLYGLTALLLSFCSGKNTGTHPAKTTASSLPEVQAVRKTFDIITCEKIFGEDLDALEERNEILLQTGRIDITDEQPPVKVAGIRIADQDMILNFLRTYAINERINEEYAGNGYKLTLTYKESKTHYHTVLYTGKFVIETGKLRKEYTVTGWDGNL